MVKMPHWPKQFGRDYIDLGLTRIKSLLKKLGDPEKKIPPVIHDLSQPRRIHYVCIVL